MAPSTTSDDEYRRAEVQAAIDDLRAHRGLKNPTSYSRTDIIEGFQRQNADRRANTARVIRANESRKKGNGPSQLLIPSPELLEEHEEAAKQADWLWPKDPVPAPLAGMLARFRLHLPDQWTVSLQFDPPAIVLCPNRKSARDTSWRGLVREPIKDHPAGQAGQDEAVVTATKRALERAGLGHVAFHLAPEAEVET